jgi:dihydrofolate reductase
LRLAPAELVKNSYLWSRLGTASLARGRIFAIQNRHIKAANPWRMKPFKAIAAMSLNRVIGAGNKIPWHLPEDFKWFKKMTTGHVIVMGRKTFESIGKPLPNRSTIVLSRSPLNIPGVKVITDLKELDSLRAELTGREVFVCGGAQVYQQALPMCSDLYLTLVKQTVEGDTFFPAFEDKFMLKEEVLDEAEFKILHYRAN